MTTLHLGVVDVAYSGKDGSSTTGEVAGYLEAEYHIMRTFLEVNEEKIADFLADAMAGQIETMAQSGVTSVFGKSIDTQLGARVISGVSMNGRIEEKFRDFLDAREWKTLSGQKVDAADAGVNHRKKRPTVKANPARAEFVDTGLYSASFRAWID
jgi:hypothetical protein